MKEPSLQNVSAMGLALRGSAQLVAQGEHSIYSPSADPFGYYDRVVALAYKRGQLKDKGRKRRTKADEQTKDRIAKALAKADAAGFIAGALEAGVEWGFDSAFGNTPTPLRVGTTTVTLPQPDREREVEKHAIAAASAASAGVLIAKWLQLSKSDTAGP